jgi:hypothetical protein
MPDDLASIRHQLKMLANRKKARRLDFPRDWRPHEVLNPLDGQPFSDTGAWEFIAELLDQGQELDLSPQEQPPGVTAYVMQVPLKEGQLYIKVRLGAGYILGRSFHYSDKRDSS